MPVLVRLSSNRLPMLSLGLKLLKLLKLTLNLHPTLKLLDLKLQLLEGAPVGHRQSQKNIEHLPARLIFYHIPFP